jgi:hypothetical protein
VPVEEQEIGAHSETSSRPVVTALAASAPVVRSLLADSSVQLTPM